MLFDKLVEFVIDTGSQVTLIPCTIACSLDMQASSSQGIINCAYGGATVLISGVLNHATISHAGHSHKDCVLIASEHCKPILSMNFLTKLGFVQTIQCVTITSPQVSD